MNRRTLALLACVLWLTGCATPGSRVLSPGPSYSGAAPVARLSIYVFVDARPEYIHPAFRQTLEAGLARSFEQAAVPSQQRWFGDTEEGRRLRADMKGSTLGNTTFVSVGRTLRENAAADAAFQPTHRLVVFPTDSYREGAGARLDIKWDVLDAANGYVEWSVYTRTPVLSQGMAEAEALAAAQGLVQAITAELQARGVIRP